MEQPIFIYAFIKDEQTLNTAMRRMRKDILKCLANHETLDNACERIVAVETGPADDVFRSLGYVPGFMPPYACLRVKVIAYYQYDQIDGG